MREIIRSVNPSDPGEQIALSASRSAECAPSQIRFDLVEAKLLDAPVLEGKSL